MGEVVSASSPFSDACARKLGGSVPLPARSLLVVRVLRRPPLRLALTRAKHQCLRLAESLLDAARIARDIGLRGDIHTEAASGTLARLGLRLGLRLLVGAG